MNSKVIVWLDLETSGLVPETEKIFEVGIILTDWDLNEIDRKSWIINQTDSVIDGLIPYVRKMHTTNGLLEEMKNTGQDERAVEIDIVYFLMNHVEKSTKFVVGGNSVSFDRRFIEVHLKVLDTFLHHRIIDMTTIMLLAERWTPIKHKDVRGLFGGDHERAKQANHRAIYDIETCLKYAQQFKQCLFIDRIHE